MRRSLLGLGAAVLATVAACPQPSTSANTAAVVLDKTLLCSATYLGGVYEIQVRAHAGVRKGRSSWLNLPFAVVSSGQIGSRANALQNSLAWASAGRPAHETNLPGDYGILLPAQMYGTLAFNNRDCRPVKARVPLTTRGLEGGQADQLGDSAECQTPRRVLVRVRAVSQVRAVLYGDGDLLKTRTSFSAGYLAVRTQAGRPLAYAAVFQSGKTRLFTAKTCLAE